VEEQSNGESATLGRRCNLYLWVADAMAG